MEDTKPRGIFDIVMLPKYWIAFFVGKFTAWVGTQGKKQHNFDRCMLKIISGNLSIFETSSLPEWKYPFNSVLKCNHFECNRCGAVINFEQCNSFDLSHLLVTSIQLHMEIKPP